ncbi:hypothetical protein N7510_003289 [Penicillium lagena]|uniref:uncharacterized protein n=1 Tax=Penicillium lagena TaxID=94218 RepID=UPI002540D217|nr:uncharacterized protein N7510_003289 [Penicillium lagena]KAJ5619305.1 hypothetical protein N7510_003289 [Penicillium lagena]
MDKEPPEEAIANFVSFTSTTREQAISFLKANYLDSQKAINAYFEDPTGPHPKTSGYFHDNPLPSFEFPPHDNAPRAPVTVPPSRPPSRANTHDPPESTSYQAPTETTAQGATDSGQGLSLAEREEKELQRAMAMSLNQGMGEQETGVVASTGESHFGKATRDHYDEGAWAMTLFNTSSQEVIISPDPEDRKKINDEPAFIRPSQDNLYLGGFLTILHNIPLAREALLLRNKVLYDYGHDAQWWNGQPINLPKIVTIHEAKDGDEGWDDIIYETQRLMAFLDSTNRAFGSADALANLKSIFSTSADSEEAVTRFLEAWHGAAIRADPDNQMASTFLSHAYKHDPYDYEEPQSKELFTFAPPVENYHRQTAGQTLYDVFDYAMWSDTPGQDLDDVWLEHVAEVLTIKLDATGDATSVGIKIPAVFYPDRYLSSCRELAREYRIKRLQMEEDLLEVERRIDHYTHPKTIEGNLTYVELFEQAAAAAPVAVPKYWPKNADGSEREPPLTMERAGWIVEELRKKIAWIEEKLKNLEIRKQSALEALRNYSKTLTEPSDSPTEPPVHKYTLRGVCTQPHVTYVLRRNNPSGSGDAMDVDSEYHWWRISFSAEDGKTKLAEKRAAQGDSNASQHGDMIGYTAKPVREVEVLHAAREEWRNALLVYASENAMRVSEEAALSQLRLIQQQSFTDKDNEAFAAEFEQASADPIDRDWPGTADWDIPQNNAESQSASQQGQLVNVSAEEVLGQSQQEMQEKAGSSFLGAASTADSGRAEVKRDENMTEPE